MFDQEPPLHLVEEGFPTDLPPCSAPHPSPLPSFWTSNYSGSLKNANSTGSLPLHADVVVIGSGLTGTCVAAHLVEGLLKQRRELALGEDALGSAVSVLVLEGREFCSGATGELARAGGVQLRMLIVGARRPQRRTPNPSTEASLQGNCRRILGRECEAECRAGRPRGQVGD